MTDSGSRDRIVHGSRGLRGQSLRASRGAAPPPGSSGIDEQSLREQIVAIAVEMSRLGLNQGSSGNLSARLGTDMLITPSAISYAALRPRMIVRMSLAAHEPPETKPVRASSEWRMHRDILRARPDANAVCHCHSVNATALSMLRQPIPPVHYMIALFGGADVRCAPYAPFGTQALSDASVDALRDRVAALLGNHGAVTIGGDLASAFALAQELETLCAMIVAAGRVGSPCRLTDAEIEDARERFADYRRPPSV